MTIYIDDREVDIEAEDLDAVLQTATESLQNDETGRIVVEVQIDGHALGGDEIEKRRSESVSESEIRLYSSHPRDVALSVLEGVAAALNDASAAQAKAAELLQQDDASKALVELGPAIEIWQQVQQAVLQSSLLLNVDLNSIEFDGKSFAVLEEALKQQLTQFIEALRAQDTVALADALAYEWPETITHWQRFIELLIEHVED